MLIWFQTFFPSKILAKFTAIFWWSSLPPSQNLPYLSQFWANFQKVGFIWKLEGQRSCLIDQINHLTLISIQFSRSLCIDFFQIFQKVGAVSTDFSAFPFISVGSTLWQMKAEYLRIILSAMASATLRDTDVFYAENQKSAFSLNFLFFTHLLKSWIKLPKIFRWGPYSMQNLVLINFLLHKQVTKAISFVPMDEFPCQISNYRKIVN